MDLIYEFVRGRDPPTIERHRSKGRQPDTEERLGNYDGLSDNQSKGLPDCHPILSIISLTIDGGEQKTIPHRILGFHWQLWPKISK
jgi:hypothetical protein